MKQNATRKKLQFSRGNGVLIRESVGGMHEALDKISHKQRNSFVFKETVGGKRPVKNVSNLALKADLYLPTHNTWGEDDLYNIQSGSFCLFKRT